MKTIIVLYEYSGVFSDLYRDAGFNVIQIEKLLDGSDARLMEYTGEPVHGILAFPPCTHLAGSGARWWEAKGDQALIDSLSMVDVVFRMVCLYNPEFWVLENPIGRLYRFIGKPSMYFHPFEYAGWSDNPDEEAYTKKTCLWGNFNIPEKKAVDPVLGSKMHLLPPSPDRAMLPSGFAKAFFNYNN